MQAQNQGPFPLTGVAMPREQRLPVGAVFNVTPFADPHNPSMAVKSGADRDEELGVPSRQTGPSRGHPQSSPGQEQHPRCAPQGVTDNI